MSFSDSGIEHPDAPARKRPRYSSAPAALGGRIPSTPAAEEKATLRFDQLSKDDRESFYKKQFGHTIEPLQLLSSPDLCTKYPALQQEIFSAYLNYTMFSVKVWVNYDTAAKRFFIDERTKATGKLIIPDPTLRILQEYGETFAIRRIVFELGTAFKTLCCFYVAVVQANNETGFSLETCASDVTNGHKHLKKFMTNVSQNLFGTECEQSLTLDDLISLADGFCLEPNNNDRVVKERDIRALKQPRLRRDPMNSRFMMIDDERDENPGYLDHRDFVSGHDKRTQRL